MEFELDNYRKGKIKQKRRNLSCIKEYKNDCKNKHNDNKGDDNKKKEKIKNDNLNNNIIEKPISVNSNNNYLIKKLQKENENLRLKLSKYESSRKYDINKNSNNDNDNDKSKPIDNKARQKKIENAVRITKKLLNDNKLLMTKSSNNISEYAHNTYTTNFYRPKDSVKFKANINNNNLSFYNNYNTNIFNTKTMSTNSFVAHDKKNIKNCLVKSLSGFRSSSRIKESIHKTINNDKIKTNYKRIQSKFSNNNIKNYIEMKLKEKKNEKYLNNLNTNNSRSRLHTLSSNFYSNIQKNIISWKQKHDKEKTKYYNNLNLNNINNANLCNTDRKKTDINIASNSNSKERNTHNYFLTNNEFNLTWSRFPQKSIETSFEHYVLGDVGERNKKDIICSSNNKTMNTINLNNSSTKLLSKINSKNRSINKKKGAYMNEQSDKDLMYININGKRKDVTPQKITINRRMNNKNKNTNNISMKNMLNHHQNSNRSDNFIIIKENIFDINENNKKMNNNITNNLHQGDIYVHKKKNSNLNVENQNTNNNNNNEGELKKHNTNVNSKYNVTINNINNCNYISLIQATNKSEFKIIKKKDN
jgi:hypothetical protein